MKKGFLLFLLLFIGWGTVQASHVFGGEITWKAVRDNNAQNFQRDGYGFIFIMTVYRDCSGIPMNGLTPTISVQGNPIDKSGSVITRIPLRQGPGILGTGYEITPVCSGTTSVVRCGASNPLSGSGGGSRRGAIAGVQFWSDTVWLTGVPPVTGWLFQSSAGAIPCCRNANNNTSCSGEMILRAKMYPYFNKSINGTLTGMNVQFLGDGSPQFAEHPASVNVQNPGGADTIIYNNNAIDFDLDFTRYWIDNPFSALNTPCSYSQGFSISNPMPGIIQPYGYGISAIDTISGELRFLPNTQGNYLLCIRVESYRGNQKIAEVFRDFQSVNIANSPGLGYNITQRPPIVSTPFSTNSSSQTFNKSFFIGDYIEFNVRAFDYNPLGDSVYLVLNNNPVFGAFVPGFDTIRIDSGCVRPPCAVVEAPVGKRLAEMSLNGLQRGYGIGGLGNSEVLFKWQTGCGNLKNYSLNGLENLREGLFSFNIVANDNQCPFNGKTPKSYNIKLIQPELGEFKASIKGQRGNEVVVKFDSLVNLVSKENLDTSLNQSIIRRAKNFHKISIYRDFNQSGYQFIGEITNPKYASDSLELNWISNSQYFIDSLIPRINGLVKYSFKTLTGCDSFETVRYDTISINFTSILIPSLPDTISACGKSAILDAGNFGANFLWNTGETTQQITVAQSGWYHVTISTQTNSLRDSVYVDLLSVDLGNDTAICAGETYVINPFVKGNPNLKNGLMAAYSFDGNAYDFSGNGNHGKPRGVTPTTDRFGNPNGAYFFRGFGNNDHVFVPNHPSMHIDSVYTMSLWYKEIPGNAMNGVGAYSPTNGTAALFAKEGDGIGTPPGFFADINYNANGGYSLNYLQVDGCCGVRSKFQAQFSHPMQVDSTWKHVVIVNTKDYAETYINGVKVKFASMPSTFLAANRNNLYFGSYGNGKQSPFWYPFYGSMDEVFMYNRALDSNEISALYQLQNSQNQFTYTWSNGATTPYIGVTPAQTTTYYCTVSNGITSCVDSVTITVKPNPPVVALPDTLFQCGNPGRLDAGNPGATYLWSNKATTQSILPVNGGWYSVVVNQNGCTATDSSYVDLLTLDLGRDTSICIGSSITLSVQGQNLGNTTPDSIFVPTDASWKVSVLNPEGWEFVGFNDTNSFWPSARIQGTSNISGAQPIWHPDGTGVYDAYFRKVFEVNGQPNTDFQLEISAENEYYAFVNGRFVGYGNSSMGAKQTYPIAQNLIQGYNSIAIFASNWGVSTAQLSALITGTTDKKSYLWTTGDTTSSITVAPTQTTTYYCTVTNGYTFCTDSMVVRVGTPQAISIQGTTCSNQPYVFGGRMISQPGVYVDSLRSSFGCDSVVTLTLNVNPISLDSISAKVCGNSTYIFGGKTLTQSGIYMDTLQNSLGCDSFVVLDLQFAQPDTQRINTAICNGSSYAFNGQNLTQSGVYQSILTNSQGCDSVIILTLNVNASPVITLNDSICRGQVYSFGGQLYSNSGQYSFNSVSQSGCTTTVVLNLVVNEIQKAVITANGPLEFCGNGSVSFAASTGRSYLWSTGARTSSIQVRQSNSIWVEVTDFNGCVSRSDSQVVIQRLTVPTRPDTIIGFMNPCGIRGTNNLATYSVARDSNATSYLWMLTDGIVAVGRADSDVIEVLYPADYTTGQIRVTPQNACGNGLPRAIYPRTGKPTNAPIVSQADIAVCAIRGTGNTATYSVFQADGCNGYLWTVPKNATLVSGQGTTSIQVSFSSVFSSGTITVVGISPCGNTNSRSIGINLLPKPVINGPAVLCPGDTATFTIPTVSNAIRYRFTLPAGLVLVRQNLNTAVIRNAGSFISGSLTAQVQTSNCGWSQPGALALNTVACRSVANESLSIAIYPNPSRGEFQLQLGTMVSNIQVSLYASDGRLVKREMVSPVQIQTLNYQNLAEGLYHLEVVATDLNQQVVRHLEKLMIQR